MSPPPSKRRLEDEVTDPSLLEATQMFLQDQLAGRDASSVSEDAWECFYDLYSPVVRRFAISCGVSQNEVDDCVQDALQSVLQALPEFRYDAERGRFRTWLYTLVRNKATDMVRRRARRPTSHLSPQVASSLHDETADPAAEFENRWNVETVHAVLAQLEKEVSSRDYRVFYMRAIEGRSVQEVADTTGSSVEKVRYRHHRVKKRFAQLFSLYTGVS